MNATETSMVQEKYNKAQKCLKEQLSMKKELRNPRLIAKCRAVSETLKRWLSEK